MSVGLPSFQCSAYRDQAPLWAFLDDVFDGSEAWLGRDEAGNCHISPKSRLYLPREAAESDSEYLNRLVSSPFFDKFRQSLTKFVNMILANGIKQIDIPPVIQGHLENVDNQGATFRRFVKEVALAALRRGHTFVLIDYPPGGGALSQAEFERSGRRPYWVHLHSPNVINWAAHYYDGRWLLDYVVLRETATLPDGMFREKEQTFYRLLTPGRVDVFTVEKQRGKEVAIHHPDRSGAVGHVLPNGMIDPLKEIPLVCIYGGLREGLFKSKPPLKSLADLNLTHYRVKSDHLRKVHLCCLPVPELRDATRGDEDLTIGPNSVVVIRDPNGSFNWKEPLATSIEQSRREVLDLEAAMDLLSAAYLLNPSDRQAALTTQAQVVELEGDLQSFCDDLVDGLNECLRYHAIYLKLPDGGRIELSGDILKNEGTDSQMMMAYSLLQERKQISRDDLMSILTAEKYIPDGVILGRQPLNDDSELLKTLINLGLHDALPKRDVLQLMKLHNYLPSEYDIDASLQRTGEQFRLTPVGRMGLTVQPTEGDQFLPIP